MDFINGNKFLEIADFAIDFDHKDLTTDIFKNNAIIYCKTDFLDLLFNYIQFSGRKYILITHMSDYPINEFRFEKAPKSIVKWFAQNAVYKNSDLIPIPLGIENHKGTSKGKFTNHKWFKDNIERLHNKEKDYSVLYCNWNSETNQETRGNIIPQLEKNYVKIHHETGLSFEEYCENMSNYKFVICPPGNGVDTHRIWESLYMGCIPIILDHHIFNSYNLPIMKVKNWPEVTYDNLNMFLGNPFNDEELSFTYWHNLINEEFLKIM